MSSCTKIILFCFLFCFLSFGAIVDSFGQTSWKSVQSGAAGDLVSVFFTSAERGFVVGDKGYFAYTTDGGKSWKKQVINTDDDINEIYFRNDDNGYVVAGKKMFLTDDAGRSWREVRIYKPGDFKNLTPVFLSIRYADKKRGLIVGYLMDNDGDVADSLIMRTEDGGETWTRIVVPSKLELYHLDFVDSSHGWIVGDRGLILATYDGGVNWQIQKSGTVKALYNVDFRDASEGYAVGKGGTILRTENGGDLWETVKTNFPATFLRVDFADDKNGWIAGYGGSILRSSDRGKTWIKQDGGTKENLYGLFMTKKYGWAVGAKGSIIKYER